MTHSCVIWLIHMWTMSYLLTCETHVSRSYEWAISHMADSYDHMTCETQRCPCLRNGSLIWQTHMCDMTQLTHMCDMTQLYVWHDKSPCHVTCIVESCHLYNWVMSHMWVNWVMSHMWVNWVMSHMWVSHMNKPHDTITQVTWHEPMSCHMYSRVMTHKWDGHMD